MRVNRIVALAAVLAAGISAPALADWNDLGRVHFDYGLDRSSAFTGFAGGIDSLQFTARGSDINCRSVRATFDNGASTEIFTGHLAQGVPKFVAVPGNSRHVRRLDFTCRTFVNNGADVSIAADFSHYRDEWRRDPTWAQRLGALLTPPPGPGWNDHHDGDHHDWDHRGGYDRNGPGWDNPDHWVLVGTETFGRGVGREVGDAGWAGRRVTAIALKAMDGDAVCLTVEVRFAGGTRTRTVVNNGNRMEQGRLYRIDLPGDVRNIDRLVLRCSAAGQHDVRVQTFASK